MYQEDIAELRQRVAALETALSAVLARLDGSTPAPAAPDAVSPEVRGLLARGGTIEAIKQLRHERGLDLAEAKRIVDAL